MVVILVIYHVEGPLFIAFMMMLSILHQINIRLVIRAFVEAFRICPIGALEVKGQIRLSSASWLVDGTRR